MTGDVTILAPNMGPADLESRLAALVAAPVPAPFAPEALALLERLSAAIRKDAEARRYSEILAFAFWMRPKALERLRDHYRRLAPPDARLVGQGVVFHLPPANVALLFAYGWVLSLLAGNRNIVRLSARSPAQAGIVLRLIDDALATAPEWRAGQLFLSYGHDDAVTERLSALCDLRVVWGGDRTVDEVRKVRLPPLASEIAFGDRFSMAAFRAEAVLALSNDACRDLAAEFFNDVFWFDQMACSSPRLVLWVGDAGAVARAAPRLYAELAGVAALKRVPIDAGVVAAKLSYCYRAILDGPVERLATYGGRLAVLSMSRFHDFRDDVFGAGTLAELRLPSLSDLVPLVRRKDQTLVHFGFAAAEIGALAEALGGRGLDRLVPVGQALAFDHVWDGHDLVAAFSRTARVVCSS